MRMLREIGAWFTHRLGLGAVRDLLIRHPVPPGTASRRTGWMFVFGTATLVAFLLQVATGIPLATRYIPSPAHAYDSIRFITEHVRFGSLLRAMHYFGAAAMVVLALVHMARVFLTGSYKFPREMNWITGVALLVLTLAMAFTGQLLRWDANGVWGVYVASHYVGRVPLIGETLKELMLGGNTVGGATLSRFYAFHVILVPLLVFGMIGVHLYLVLRHGISEPPKAGRRVRPEIYRRSYPALLRRSRHRYFPDVAWREAVFATVVVLSVLALAAALGPKAAGEMPDPAAIPAEPKPDWFLIWYYGLLAFKPAKLETLVMVYLPILVVVGLIALPVIFGRGERSPLRRPWSVLALALTVTALGVLTQLGIRAPWVMEFDAGEPPANAWAAAPEQVRRGAALFHDRGCIFCHAVEGVGGDYGPALDDVMRRLPPEIVTVRIVEGIGNMPAYRATLPTSELEAILMYLQALAAR
jgi:ubiquinol-cytochrome c reductase cytochrome b subunit